MKKLFTLLILTIPILLIIKSCKRGDDDIKEWPIPQELLDYYYFKPGSMWVYENDKTGEKDTVIIKSAFKYWIDGNRGDRYEQAEVTYYSKTEGYSYFYYCNTQGSSSCIRGHRQNNGCYSLRCAKYKPGNYVGESLILSYKFFVGNWGYADLRSDSSKFEIKALYDSIEINTQIYTSVCKVHVNYCLTYQNKDVNFYWAKNIGIAKIENITDNENWNLIYHQIVK